MPTLPLSLVLVALQGAAPVSVAAPDRPLVDMEQTEDYSEAVANAMLEFSDKLRRRDFGGAAAWLTEDFRGGGFAGLTVQDATDLPLGARRTRFDPASAPTLERDAFLASIAGWIGPWRRVEYVLWKVKEAEFQAETPLWGSIRFFVTYLGTGDDGGPRSITVWGRARAERVEGAWKLSLFALESLQVLERPAYLFTDVSVSAGVAHTGIRFGQPGNASFAWNGAAAGDVDGDGAFDLFVPSRPRNFLYLARGERGFADEAAKRGLAEPAGGTGAAFFDFDDDGDQDLAVADVGWTEKDGSLGGNRLRLWVNAGGERAGTFEERGEELGFDARCNGYSLTVFDADLDGDLDVFVANYGRIEAERNDSWIDARNGMPDALFRNEGGRGFRDVAAEVGLRDVRWGYASASADADRDGDQDLYVANDYATNSLWENRLAEDGELRFVDVAASEGVQDLGNGMGCAFADLDSDGRLDLYVANMSSTAGNRILKRLATKEGRWKELAKMAGGNTIFLARDAAFEGLPSDRGGVGASWAWSPAAFDLDLDGRLDLYCCNGFVTGDTAADT